MEDRRIIHEITPLMGKDVLYIADRHKKEFTYPIHNHEVSELNFVEHAPGVRRIVGDSTEVIGEYDLVLITSPDLEHVWEQHICQGENIREITVQFDFQLDGSAEQYIEAINRIGIQEQTAVKDVYYIRKKVEFKDEETGACITLLPDENFSITTMISYDSQVLASQFATLDDPKNFDKEIAAARTFVFVREIEPLLAAGLIKGGDLDNAIVIYEREVSQDTLDKLADMIGTEHCDAKKLGYLNRKPLVWENEPARHKLLDIIGDMALIGKPICGRIIATRPGHTINNKFARQMRREIRKHDIQAPAYDVNQPPIMDVNRIRECLPHRYPFQLVDKVIEVGSNYIVAVKNVTSNEPFFQGHFPQEPVMPGVLQIEAMAQAGGMLVLSTVEEPERWSTYFMKIDEVKFRQKVVPGDTLVFRVALLAPLRHGISSMKGYAFVGENVVCEATFTAQIIKNK